MRVTELLLGVVLGVVAVSTAREAAAADTTIGELARYGLAAVLVIFAAGAVSAAFFEPGERAARAKRAKYAERVARKRRQSPATRVRVTHPSPALQARGARSRRRGSRFPRLSGE